MSDSYVWGEAILDVAEDIISNGKLSKFIRYLEEGPKDVNGIPKPEDYPALKNKLTASLIRGIFDVAQVKEEDIATICDAVKNQDDLIFGTLSIKIDEEKLEE